eukprot:TRINITY_DN18189_c0_g1_i1.p1 TRINITY_DN18189_c0_g1~~TRINITY_DN18189_c0_g1_i1.p1  ORF type:complete len:266 (-),score=77.70 TRINITY_DN18189_c0_g1_i1:152-949(-)
MAARAAISDELKSAIQTGNSAAGQTRFITVCSDNETLTVKNVVNKSGSWTRDFDKVKDELEDETPLYIVFWKDQASERAVFTGRESVGHAKHSKSKILLMLFSPDDAPVREKMTYASFWKSMKDICGAGADEFQASTKAEFTYANFSKLRETDDSLLSEAEKVLRDTAIADPVSMEEAKAASGFNIIAMSKGITEMPKVVQDSLQKAHAARTSIPSKRPKMGHEPSSRTSGGGASWVTNNDQVESGETLVKPSQMKKWPPEKPSE